VVVAALLRVTLVLDTAVTIVSVEIPVELDVTLLPTVTELATEASDRVAAVEPDLVDSVVTTTWSIM